MSDKSNYGYLAGMIDGEGHISISKSTTIIKIKHLDGSIREKNSPRYMINFGITNTNIKLIKWLIEKFGGTFYNLKRNNQNLNWKNSYRWQITSNKKQELLLLAIMPYLVIKKEQAKIALEFIRMNGQQNPEKRELLYQEILKLNERGKTVETNMLEESINDSKIESELIGNNKSDIMVT